MMHKYLSLILFSLAIPIQASEVSTDQLLFELQQDMDQYAKIATNTKQNVDYMPYVVSTLKEKDLSSLGVLNLREALTLIPSVDLNVGMAGVKNPIFRGSNPFAYGQSKLIIDGVLVNDQIFGGYNQYLDMPVHIIQRIEVVRGPGSLLSHANGYAGSIHVITKANRDDLEKVDNEVFTSFGSNDYGMAGGIVSYSTDNYSLSADVFYQEHDLELSVSEDRFGNSGDTDQSLENYQVGINFNSGSFKIKGRFAQNDSGVSYGQSFSLTDDSRDYLDVGNNSLEASYNYQLSDTVTLDFTLGYFDENRELQNKVMPNGAMMLPNGRYFLVDYNEKSYLQRVQTTINSFNSHTITAGIQVMQSYIRENDASMSNDNLQTFSNFDLFSKESRHHTTYYIDDLIQVDEQVSLQLGLKYDQYSDVKDQVSPRLALVYRHDDVNIFKAMYSHSYREPSWREQYLNAQAFYRANLDLEAETVDAYELAYIRKMRLDEYFKLNVFYLDNQDQIHAQNNTNTFENSGDNELYGIEFEYQRYLTENGKLYLNYSYVDGSNVSGELANSSQHIAKAYYIHQLTNNLNLSGIYKYVGEKGRIEDDIREDVNDYSLVDVTLEYNHQPTDLSLSFSVKNLFDKEYDLSSPDGTYPDDFEQDGRTVLFQLRKRFK